MSIIMNDVTVKFKKGVVAVDHVNLEIPHGVFGLLGENGAGKTTLMRVLTTILKPTGGTVLMNGTIYQENHYGNIRKQIGYLPQELNLYPNLSVWIVWNIWENCPAFPDRNVKTGSAITWKRPA